MADLSNPDPGFVPLSEEQLAQLQDDIAGLLAELDATREQLDRADDTIHDLVSQRQRLVDAIVEHRRATSHTEPADLELWKSIGHEETT